MIHQISVFVENRFGRLAEVTGVLKDNNIDIRALSIADTTDFGILRLIVNDPEKAAASLKAAGMTVSKTEVVAVRLADTPGSLHSILCALKDAQIGVEYVYAFLTKKNDDAFVILRVEDNARACDVLVKQGFGFLSPSDVYGI